MWRTSRIPAGELRQQSTIPLFLLILATSVVGPLETMRGDKITSRRIKNALIFWRKCSIPYELPRQDPPRERYPSCGVCLRGRVFGFGLHMGSCATFGLLWRDWVLGLACFRDNVAFLATSLCVFLRFGKAQSSISYAQRLSCF